jgi:hypothetical protein
VEVCVAVDEAVGEGDGVLVAGTGERAVEDGTLTATGVGRV